MVSTLTPPRVAIGNRLRSLSIVGGFLEGQHFDLAEALNCLTGPKGTGKTTVLENIRYVIDALPADPDARRRIESIVQYTLADGTVELQIEKDGIPYKITRRWGERPLVFDSEGELTAIQAKGLFQADIYSANEIEFIADNASSQLALLDTFEKDRIGDINGRIERVRETLKRNAAAIWPAEERLTNLDGDLHSLPDVEDRLRILAASQVELPELDEAHQRQSLLQQQVDAVQSAVKHVDEWVEMFRQGSQLCQGTSGYIDESLVAGAAETVVGQARKELSEFAAEIDEFTRRGTAMATKTRQAMSGYLKKLIQLRDKDEVALHKLQEKFKEEKAKSVERMRLERQRNELNAQKRIQREVAQKLKELWAQRETLLQELSQLEDERTAVRQAVVEKINESLGPTIRVSLSHSGDSSLYQQLLAECLADSRMKYTAVAEKLSQAFAPAELAAVLRKRNRDRLVEGAGINPEQAEKTVAKLADSERLFEIEAVELVDLPKIELLDGQTYKDSLTLSSGQKCTAILPILMLDSKNPLMIDQPEDNLDNSFVYETIVSTIHKMKGRRQMVFVTHNPNIPVLGDAEMLFLMRSDGLHGKIVASGSLEALKVQVMALEGGPAAFEARMARYGY